MLKHTVSLLICVTLMLLVGLQSTSVGSDILIDTARSLFEPHIVDFENMGLAYQSDPCFLDYAPRWRRFEDGPGYLVLRFDSTKRVDLVAFRHTNTHLSEDRLRVEGLTIFGANEYAGPWIEVEHTVLKNEFTTAAWYLLEIFAEFEEPVNYVKIQIEGDTSWTPHIAKIVLRR